MKRSARIIQMLKGRDGNKENQQTSIELCPAITPDNEEISDFSPDFSDTDSLYTPPRHDNTSEESSMENIGIQERACLSSGETQSYDVSPMSQKNFTPTELKSSLSDKLIEQPLNVDDCDLSHISNSPCSIAVVESKFLKSVSSVIRKNEATSEHGVAAANANNTSLKENNCNDNIITTPKRKPKSTNVVRSKDYCFYCEALVLNFARHLLRHHINETDVQQIISQPKKSLERKKLIISLRKKGNFIQNSVEVTKPMRKQKFTEYLPCTNCLGFYSKKLLWKHKKQCTGVSKISKNIQSEAQNLLLRHLKIDEKLKVTVFPRMRADKISLVAKGDVLICAFGAQYLKTHREKHFVNVVSRKMRELAKLLLQMKKMNPSINDLFDALRPTNYDVLVEATKVVGKYDPDKDRYETPTFAMNISTSIKQCCNIAIIFALKRQGPYMDISTAEIESDLKTLIQIIDANWKFDISSQAATDLNKKKWNKVTIVPLANDLKILKEYLTKKSEEATNQIKGGSYNAATYVQLLETVYCRVLLLNRRRPGELQRIKLHDYLENNVSDKYEEFDRALNCCCR